ncbi:phospholipase [Nitrospira sp.]|nr:phospholipase [Nitrospira sp.]
MGVSNPPVLQPGRNCWRLDHADRVAFLIDAASYFDAFYRAALRAERSIVIVSWDIDTRTKLLRGEPTRDFPDELGQFLRALLRRKRRLKIHILNWDFAMIYAWERQWMPMTPLGWQPHRRLEYELNDQCPLGGCQHEKLVVIDDTVAFIGGMDLTKNRWDTPEHAVDNPLRVDPGGARYAPFHDVHAVVAGDVARSLGDLARSKWEAVTGRRLAAPPRRVASELWPESVAPDLQDLQVGLARTRPAWNGEAEIREIERLYRDAIASAERWVMLETQYFTARAIGEALHARLSSVPTPEVVCVTRQNSDGWLEAHTMDVLRARLVRRLRASPQSHRFRIYCPTVPGLRDGECIGVHSKVLIVDDDLVTIGSANASNRSMGLDTECNVVVESRGDQRVRDGIARLRHRLLGEHLGETPDRVEETERRRGSVIASIAELAGGSRQLCDCDCDVTPDVEHMVPDAAIIDPERPVDSVALWKVFARAPEHRRASRGVWAVVSLLSVMVLLAAAWRWGPLKDMIDMDAFAGLVGSLRIWPDGVLLLLGAFVVGGLLAVPVTLLIGVTAAVLGPILGFAVSLGGSLASALTTFALGRWLGRGLVRRLGGSALGRVSRRLAANGLLAVIFMRVVPLAPFSVVNLAAGASRIGTGPFVLGTILGMSPGIFLAVLFIDRLAAAIMSPDPATFAAVLVIGIGGWVGAAYLVRRMQRADRQEVMADEDRAISAG